MCLVHVRNDDQEWEWTLAEQVRPRDKPEWEQEKREGSGRDGRLLPAEACSGDSVSLFRDVARVVAKEPRELKRFEGPSAARELSTSICNS